MDLDQYAVTTGWESEVDLICVHPDCLPKAPIASTEGSLGVTKQLTDTTLALLLKAAAAHEREVHRG
jgi:hypothetical protein